MGSRVSLRWQRTLIISFLPSLMLAVGAAWGQANPPKIHQKIVDDFGVERKTGRIALPVPPLLSVGGSGDAALSATFGYVDGADFQQNVPAWVRYNNSVPDGKTGKFFDYATVEFDGTSDTFRRETNTGQPYAPEYPSGSTFYIANNSTHYMDKYGSRVTISGGRISIDYTDGRQTRMYSVTGYGNSPASYISFMGNSPDQTIANSFGYMVKIGRGASYNVQGVNLAQDYCDPASAGLCSVSQTRQASIVSSELTRVVTNAAGSSWSYRFVKISALDRQRVRSEYPGDSYCDTPTSAEYWYLAGITSPNASSETYKVNYHLRPLTQDCRQDPTHDDITVSSVTQGDLVAQYTATKRYYGSYGSNPYDLSFWLDITAQLGQRGSDFSEANRPDPEWGASRRSLTTTKDRLGRQTYYTFNGLREPAGTTYPLGNSVQLTYDMRYNVTEQTLYSASNQVPLVTKFSYSASCNAQNQAYCNKPLTMIDPRGGQTDYTYNTAGQVTSQTSAATPAGDRPRKLFQYDLRTAYIKDGGGNAVPAGPAISMLVRSIDCSTATPCSGTADEIVTEYDYGPMSGLSNLRVKSVAITAKNAAGNLETLRTCYTYNYFGEKIGETKPLGATGGCS